MKLFLTGIIFFALLVNCSTIKIKKTNLKESAEFTKEVVRLIEQMLDKNLSDSNIKVKTLKNSPDTITDENGFIIKGQIIENWLVNYESAKISFKVVYDVTDYKYVNLKIDKIIN